MPSRKVYPKAGGLLIHLEMLGLFLLVLVTWETPMWCFLMCPCWHLLVYNTGGKGCRLCVKAACPWGSDLCPSDLLAVVRGSVG